MKNIFWVIEQEGPKYLSVFEYKFIWSVAIRDAIQFCNKDDAEGVMFALLKYSLLDPLPHVAEHMFFD